MSMSNDNNDFFNNLFNDDFFKKHLDSMDFEEYINDNGEIDYDKLRNESFKMFEELTGKKVDDLFDMNSLPMDKLFPKMDDNKIGMGFIQDLESEEGKKMFDDLVEKHNLIKESEIIDMNGEEYVQELWSNKENTVNVKRVYKLNDNTTSSMLSTEEQIDIHQNKLKEAVDIEDYERAAELRDKINTLKNA